jgi:hypothetical protein
MYNRKFLLCAALSLLLLIGGCGKKEEVEKPAPTTGGGGGGEYNPSMATATLTGKALFTGQVPEPTKIQMSAEPGCQQQHPTPVFTEEVVVKDGKLQNVFVYVKEGAEKWTFNPPAEPVTIDQQGCLYTPHVFGIQVNQTLIVKNSDPFLHNIHPYAQVNPPWNIGMPNKGEVKKTFPKSEVMIPVKCDVHKWMSAYIGVVPHPFYSVTGADGAFTIKLPPGDYTIEARHEKLGSQTQKITVAANETKDLTFNFTAGGEKPVAGGSQ